MRPDLLLNHYELFTLINYSVCFIYLTSFGNQTGRQGTCFICIHKLMRDETQLTNIY